MLSRRVGISIVTDPEPNLPKCTTFLIPLVGFHKAQFLFRIRDDEVLK